MKRLFFDIETSPNLGFFWQAGYKLQIGYDNIIEERKIICICYKWEGKDKVYSLTWDKSQCDKQMLKDFIAVANQADELIGHNGDRFDLPWIRTRCLFHRIPMFPDYVTTDTLKHSRSKFKFNSNRLDYISKYLGVGAKNNGKGFDLWKDVILGKKKKALDEMVNYCKNDVVILENVHKEINKYIKQKVHKGVVDGNERWSCPKCGGDENIVMSKERVSAKGIKTFQYLHNRKQSGCGHFWTISKADHVAKLRHDFEQKQQKLK